MLFSDFAQNSVVTNKGVVHLQEGIEHIEALPIDKFIEAVSNLSNLIATEKLDGSNLIFGIDMDGKFYTSREAKSGGKFYSQNDYSDRASDNGFRSAHAALEEVLPHIKKVLRNGEAVEAEVLFGRQPNAIVYGTSRIAFLRMVPGENKKHPDQKQIKRLTKELKNIKVTVTTPQIVTTDGVSTEKKDVDHQWKFTSTSYIESHHFAFVDLKKELNALRKLLKEKNTVAGDLDLTNMDVVGINLNTVPGRIRSEVKAEKERLIKEIEEKFKLPIKEKILDKVLRALRPALRDVETAEHEDIGIEGVVVLNPKTLEQFKIVDKDVFTIINQFNFAIRKEIKSTFRSGMKFAGVSIKDEGDIFGDMLKEIASTLGMPGLGDYLSIKRTIKQFVGKTPAKTLENFTKAFKEQDVGKIKPKILAAIEEGLRDLDKGLKKYNEEWKTYTLKLKTGKEIKYTDEIHKRTLMVFAEVRGEMEKMRTDVAKSKSLGEVAVALFGKQLKTLH